MKLLVELNENINIPIILEYDIYKMDMSICKKKKYDFSEVNVYNNYYKDEIDLLVYKSIISEYSSIKYTFNEKINKLYMFTYNTDSIMILLDNLTDIEYVIINDNKIYYSELKISNGIISLNNFFEISERIKFSLSTPIIITIEFKDIKNRNISIFTHSYNKYMVCNCMAGLEKCR